ncbi:hypothetical protein H0H81_007628 [Sphagnurus paluster]|uniref:Uncharacterized protein n=1 Tax=Sphagnurus paluster TaxID=117069 RepID=A0A9P7FL17_9AGAR|nr:hypothetical protein H0H81_007628 [Sphagnurus paluster]
MPPLLLLDITEATYLQPPLDSILSMTDLIAHRAIALQKHSADLARLHSAVYTTRLKAARGFKLKHARTIHDFNFECGDLVLMRNMAIEKSLDRKMKPRYLGPLIVVSRNKGGAYIICELHRAVLHRPIAAFRLFPYFACQNIPLPTSVLDIDTKRLREMEADTTPDDEALPIDFEPEEDENPEAEEDN